VVISRIYHVPLIPWEYYAKLCVPGVAIMAIHVKSFAMKNVENVSWKLKKKSHCVNTNRWFIVLSNLSFSNAKHPALSCAQMVFTPAQRFVPNSVEHAKYLFQRKSQYVDILKTLSATKCQTQQNAKLHAKRFVQTNCTFSLNCAVKNGLCAT
jgi:hypothetical protein